MDETAYGTLCDYLTGVPLRPATRNEWQMTVKALDAGVEAGVWRDDDVHPLTVYVDGGPDPLVSDQAIRDMAGDAEQYGPYAELCDRALDGDQAARAECVALIRDYRCREAEALA